MNLLFVGAICALLAFGANAQEKLLYKTIAIDPAELKALEVKTSGGSISVSSVAGEQARMEVLLSGNGKKGLSNGEMQSLFEANYELRIQSSGGKLSATVMPKKKGMDWNNSLSVSFRVFTGKEVSTQLMTSGGSVSINGVVGTQKLMTSGGSLSVQNVGGTVDGKTSGGSITYKNSTATGMLMTSGGSITAANNSGDFKLMTSGGSLSLTNLKGRIEATTSGGSITGSDIAGMLMTQTSGGSINLSDLTCSLDAATSAGSINVGFSNLAESVQLRNAAGSIVITIPSQSGANIKLQSQSVQVPTMGNFSGSISDKKVEGKLNGGGSSISAVSNSGKVVLKLK